LTCDKSYRLCVKNNRPRCCAADGPRGVIEPFNRKSERKERTSSMKLRSCRIERLDDPDAGQLVASSRTRKNSLGGWK